MPQSTRLSSAIATLAFISVSLVATPMRLRAQADTLSPRPLFTWRDGAMAAVFMASTAAIRPLDKHYAQRLQDPRTQGNVVLHDAAIGFRTIAVPGSVIIGTGLYVGGRLSKQRKMADLGLHGTEALFVGQGVAYVLKGIFGRARPYVDTVPNPGNWQLLRGFTGGTAYSSFPSGHTVAGFAAAAAVTSEMSRWWPQYRWLVGGTMYAGASLIGLSRMYDNRHWASDVILGAAIGTFAGTKVVRYHHSHPGNHIDRWLLNFSVSPGDIHSLSMSVSPMPGRPPIGR